jgi:Fe-S-cluster containining protein
MKILPCDACNKANLSCCHNPQIAWNIQEFDDMISQYGMDVMEGKGIFRAEIPGHVYILAVNPDITEANEEENTIKLEYCDFFDPEKRNCTIYDKRPIVCETYGDPKYNECPYGEMTPEEVTELARTDWQKAYKMHTNAKSHSDVYMKDFVLPFLEAWKKAEDDKEEFVDWWYKLPTANFKRNNDVPTP